MKRLKQGLIGVIVILIGAALHYALPQVDVVRLVGTDVKRVDTQESTSDNQSSGSVSTKDVYFVLAETEQGDPRNYRNQDAIIYGKFDSSNLHTRARSVAQDEENLVAVRHYGWRLPLFSLFPNAVKVWQVEPGYRHFPLFNIVFLTLLAAGAGYAVWRIRRALSARREANEAARVEREAQVERERMERRDDDESQRARDAFLSDDNSSS